MRKIIVTKQTLKPGGLLSVYPEHMNVHQLKQEVERMGFHLDKRQPAQLIHEGIFTRTEVLSFQTCTTDHTPAATRS